MTQQLEVDWLVGECNKILVIEGHVDLEAAHAEMLNEGGEDFPAPKHAYMHWTDVPEGEVADNWRAICQKGDKGAQPVTISVLDW